MVRFVKYLVLVTVSFAAVSLVAAATLDAEEPASVDRKTFDPMVAKAIAYLETKGQSADGSYSGFSGPGVTALATTALLRHGRPVGSPAVAKGIKYLEQFVQKDGGIYKEGTLYRNYETCLAILCFTEINQDGRYDKMFKRADAFVRGIQWDEARALMPRTSAMVELATGSTNARISRTHRISSMHSMRRVTVLMIQRFSGPCRSFLAVRTWNRSTIGLPSARRTPMVVSITPRRRVGRAKREPPRRAVSAVMVP